MDNQKQADFGDYCTIEMNRYGAPNEFYTHKVIGRSQSNTWVDVPVLSVGTETQHDTIEDVVSCICCGVSETRVLKFRLLDIKVCSGYSTSHAEVENSMALWKAKAERLKDFKDFVHGRLDEAGIPTHPDGEHSKAGCRIGDRLDIALSAVAEVERLREALKEIRAYFGENDKTMAEHRMFAIADAALSPNK